MTYYRISLDFLEVAETEEQALIQGHETIKVLGLKAGFNWNNSTPAQMRGHVGVKAELTDEGKPLKEGKYEPRRVQEVTRSRRK